MHKINLYIACFFYISFLHSSGDDFDNYFFYKEEPTAVNQKKIFFSEQKNLKISNLTNLNDGIDDFVLETKKITIPGYPKAYNPSIAKWKGRWILSFRITKPQRNFIGFVWLDQNFNINSKAQIIQLTKEEDNGIMEHDARLLVIGNRLFVLYTNNFNQFNASNVTFRMYLAEIDFDGDCFYTKFSNRLDLFDNQHKSSWEKNWVPFNYNEKLHLAYSLNPHQIYSCLENEVCVTSELTEAQIDWNWGELRGGTPALLDKDYYIGIFHSSEKMKSVQSQGKALKHYFMGAYLFSKNPPFALEKVSIKPIIGPQFYCGTISQPYPKHAKIRCIFPGGLVVDERYVWVFYGRQDCEIWFAKMDKQKLLESLVPVTPK